MKADPQLTYRFFVSPDALVYSPIVAVTSCVLLEAMVVLLAGFAGFVTEFARGGWVEFA